MVDTTTREEKKVNQNQGQYNSKNSAACDLHNMLRKENMLKMKEGLNTQLGSGLYKMKKEWSMPFPRA